MSVALVRWRVRFTGRVQHVGFRYTSLYLARELSPGASHPDEDEFLNVVKVPLKDVVAGIMRGEIADAKTVCAVMMAWEKCR